MALHSFIYAKNFFKVIISIYIFTSNVCEYSFPLFPHHFFFFFKYQYLVFSFSLILTILLDV